MKCRAVIAPLMLILLAAPAWAASVTVLDNTGGPANPGQDGFVYTFSKAPFPVSEGFESVPVGKSGTGHDTHGLIKFDLSGTSVNAADVTSAKLRLYSVSPSSTGFGTAASASFPININVSPILADWNRTDVKFSTRPARGPVETSFTVDHINDWIEIDLPLLLVQGWLTTPSSNHGVYLESVGVVSTPGGVVYAAFTSGWIPASEGDPEVEGDETPIMLNTVNVPELVINTVPEPGSAMLVLCAAPVLAWGYMRRAARRRSSNAQG